jgi:ABC-type sugar transport system ATPase subunit
MQNQTESALHEMRGITKEFPGVKALDGVTFRLGAGEFHALVGENGAGNRL